jgi:branched-chain amino acid transport system permease protein
MIDASIALILIQDGIVNGAVYGLLALALVLVFTVTRVVMIPQGEFVAFAALTYAALDAGQMPASVYLLGGLGVAAFLRLCWSCSGRSLVWLALETLGLPAVIIGLTVLLAPRKLGVAVEALLAVAIIAPLGPFLYRVAFQKLAQASVLVLLIASVGAHLALSGLGLVVFGPEGARGPAFSNASLSAGEMTLTGQSLWILGLAAAVMGGLYVFFSFTLTGAALRATAVNRLGARLVGIPTAQAGLIAFWLAGAIGAASGILISPQTTLSYDSGFLVGLKGFVAAIIGGLASYPLAALAAILVGLVESFSSFWASAFKEVIVFTVIIPVLLWRSLRHKGMEDEE